MNFLLNPSIAYLFVIGAVLLVMLAIAAPGTGMLEAAAFFCILLAGYAAYNLAFNWWALFLLALSVIPFVYSLRKPRREIFVALSILLLIVGSVFMFQPTADGGTVNPLVAVAASVLVAGFLWIAARKSMEAASVRPLHDLGGLVGQVGEARTNIEDEGSVLVAGELWSAKSDKAIAAGSLIRVIRRDGFVLIVEKNAS
jgi:membrane-bound serine protease (ClpP class)